MKAVPAKHFANPLYRAELFSERSGWSGVMNAHGVNCLTFPEMPGITVTSFEEAKEIAALWNEEQNH